jgi:putative membrane protein
MDHEAFGPSIWGGGEALLGLLVPLLFLVGAVALVLLALPTLRASGRFGLGGGGDMPPPAATRPPEDRALALLRERYARGELDTADYEERRHRLRDEPPEL